jgi:hypothetical protein
MKNRNLILWLGIMAIVVIAFFLVEKQKPIRTESTTVIGPIPPDVVVSNLPASQTTPININITMETSNSVAANYHDKVVGLLSTYNDVPINFYGRLQDQHGDSVPYAAVNFIVRVDSGTESMVKRSKVMADGNGAFNITGYHGQDLSITPQKAGYVLATASTFFKYSHLEEHPFASDPNNPTVLDMWKLEGAEPLVGINRTLKLPYASTPLNFDLLMGNVVPSGGDLEILVTRAPGLISQRQQDHGDWSIQLVPVNGGIIESDFQTAQNTFEAPADGYENNYQVQMKHDDPAWFDNVQRTFFMTSRNGQIYSKFSFGFQINDDPSGLMWIQIKGVANTNGSRNWEVTAPK